MRISDWSSDVCSSDLYGRHASAVISAAAWNQIFVPVGFAHGFCTLEPDTEVLYKVSDFYAPEAEQGLLWNDPALGIDWPAGAGAVLSERDRGWPALRDLSRVFRYRSEEHTSELQSLMRISYAVFCLKKKKTNKHHTLQYTYTTENQYND